LSQGIKSLLKGQLDERDMNVYYNVRLVGFHSSDSGEGLQLAVNFQTNQRVERWEHSSSLMFGNLVCLSSRGSFQQVNASLLSDQPQGGALGAILQPHVWQSGLSVILWQLPAGICLFALKG
jgi:hypothetical protein